MVLIVTQPKSVTFTGEELADALLKGAAQVFAESLRALPRVTESDGSKWVSADVIDDMARKLESA